LLKRSHLAAAGADPDRLVIRGMENSEAFNKVVINRGRKLDLDATQAGVPAAADDLFRSRATIGAVVLECANLITFRPDIQQQFNVPVFDLASLMEFFADGYRFRDFTSRYLYPTR
jgi:hypothetical protein